MNDVSPRSFADQVASVDPLAVADLIHAQGRNGVMSTSTVALFALAEHTRSLDVIAFHTAQLLGLIFELSRSYHVVAQTCSAANVAPLIEGLTGALTALGYIQPEPQPRIQGDDA